MPPKVFVLANDYVRYVGQPVVAVIAENRYIAEDACDLITIHYETLPVAKDIETAAEDDAPCLYQSLNTNVILERAFARGDLSGVFETAHARCSRTIYGFDVKLRLLWKIVGYLCPI
jgi:CO/xanthine dehydrogenase Mo-binding subunit